MNSRMLFNFTKKKLNIYVFVYKYKTEIRFTVFIEVSYEVTVIGFTDFMKLS